MAISRLTGQDCTDSGATGNTVTLTYASAPTQNNLLIAVIGLRAQSSVQPTSNNGWTQAKGVALGGGSVLSIWYKVAGASEGTSHSWTMNASGQGRIGNGFEYSGAATSSPLDVSNSNGSTGTAVTCGATGTMAAANELCITAYYSGSTTVTFSSLDNSQSQLQQLNQNTSTLCTANVLPAATTSINFGCTDSSASQAWISAVVAFKLAPSANTTSLTFAASNSGANLGTTASAALTFAASNSGANLGTTGSATLAFSATAATYVQISGTISLSFAASLIATTIVKILGTTSLNFSASNIGATLQTTSNTVPFTFTAAAYPPGAMKPTGTSLTFFCSATPDLHYGAKFRFLWNQVYSSRATLQNAIAAKTNAIAKLSTNVINPSFENGLLGFSRVDPGWTTEANAFALDGSTVAKKLGGYQDATMVNAGRLAASSGKRVVCTAAFRSSSADGNAGCEIHWFQQDGTWISANSVIATTAAAASGAWVQARTVAVAPSNAAFGCAAVRVSSHTTGAWYADKITLEIQPQNQTDMPPVGIGSINSRWSGLTISSSYDSATPANVTLSCTAASLIAGAQTISYNSSSAVVTQTRSTTVTYYLYYLDATFSGGSLALNSTTDPNYLANNNSVIWVGQVAVTVPASGAGSGGGGSTGGGCVAIDQWLPDGRQAGYVHAADMLDCCDPETLETASFTVEGASISVQPCLRLVTESGAAVIASESTPMTLRDGSLAMLPDMMGEEVAVSRDGFGQWERVIALTDAGMRPVNHIHVGCRCYWAGEEPDIFILTHNPTTKP